MVGPVACMLGCALIFGYAGWAGVVSVRWSVSVVGMVENAFAIDVPRMVVRVPFDGGVITLPGMGIAGLVTWLLVIGTRERATVNAVLVVIKIGRAHV